MPEQNQIDLSPATERARRVRELYQHLEKRIHGEAWSPQEMMLGHLYDIGELGRLVMASQNRWLHQGNLTQELPDKLAECLWWVLVLADRLDVDLSKAFTAKMDELEAELTRSVNDPASAD